MVDFGALHRVLLLPITAFAFFGRTKSSFLDVINTSLSTPSLYRSNLFSSSLSPMWRLKFEVLQLLVPLHTIYFPFGILGKRMVGLQATSGE